MHPLFALGLVNKHINTPGLVAHCKDSSGAETNWVDKHSMKFSTITVKCNLDLEHSNPAFSQDSQAFEVVPSN